MTDSVLDVLRQYPENIWEFSFSESKVRSQWGLRARGTCINAKGAVVAFELYAPPLEAIYESAYVKVTVNTVYVFKQEWDGYVLGPKRSARKELLQSPYWKWIEPFYEENLRLLQEAKRKEIVEEASRTMRQYDEAISSL